MALEALPNFVRPPAAPMRRIEVLEPMLPAFELATKGFEVSLEALDTDCVRSLNACSGTQIHMDHVFGSQTIPINRLSDAYQARGGAGTIKSFAGYIEIPGVTPSYLAFCPERTIFTFPGLARCIVAHFNFKAGRLPPDVHSEHISDHVEALRILLASDPAGSGCFRGPRDLYQMSST